MIQKSNLFIVVLSVLTLASCKEDPKKNIPTVIQPEVMDSIFSHQFEGLIPCPDCPGIETTLSIHADSTLNKRFYYQGKEDFPQRLSGVWKLKDSVFEANFDGNKEFYKIKSGRVLARVGSDRKEVIGKLAQDYLLGLAQKVAVDSLAAVYTLGDSLSDPYRVLELKHLKKNNFEVKLQLTSQDKTAEFLAQGVYNPEAHQIEVPLAESYPDLSGVMIIQFSRHKVHIGTQEKDETEALKSFWEGISIGGTYSKEEKPLVDTTL
ncbi:copper resistance protein NlpE N-terminal domain-containing protein [Flavobacterium sp. JP2137]|uniref:copper resistance protein NlpE N-terminal domain-containing protein n=1 Tax=Flavobacterium sp. JP2137 TaxID=3414510 RepID=UPI003D2FEA0A